jgi:hypothetical protein
MGYEHRRQNLWKMTRNFCKIPCIKIMHPDHGLWAIGHRLWVMGYGYRAMAGRQLASTQKGIMRWGYGS